MNEKELEGEILKCIEKEIPNIKTNNCLTIYTKINNLELPSFCEKIIEIAIRQTKKKVEKVIDIGKNVCTECSNYIKKELGMESTPHRIIEFHIDSVESPFDGRRIATLKTNDKYFCEKVSSEGLLVEMVLKEDIKEVEK